ncbi:hypothetical protein [Sphingomonas oryzagri]
MSILILYVMLLVPACGLAVFWGGAAERLVAAVVLTGSIASLLVANDRPHRWHGSEPGLLIVDLAMLIAFAAIMLHSKRYWPIWTTAAQLLTVGAHLGPILRSAHIAIPFAFGEQIWSWFILIQLIVVSATAMPRRARRSGTCSSMPILNAPENSPID